MAAVGTLSLFMPLLTLANIQHAYGTQIVLDGATVSIEAGEKVGLVGRNGSGKTTLMRIIAGFIDADSGSMQFQKSARVGYLAQDPQFAPDETVRDVAESAFAELHALHLEARELYERMADPDLAPDQLERLLRQQEKLDAAIEAAGGYAIDHRIDATLHGLGFRDAQFGLPTSALSGGQKGRLGLARLLLEAPDLLLLDEPTNHLDIQGRQWLEEFLAEKYSGAVLVVTHDRWLLDRVVDRIIEVEMGVVRDYPGNYEKYIQLRRERQLTTARVYEKQMDKIRAEKRFIQKYKTGQRAKQARGRETRLERFKRDELVERPIELDVMRLNLPPAERSGDLVVRAEDLAMRYDDLTLFENVRLDVSRMQRIGIIGPNGVGKTTLVRCLLGDLQPTEGTVRLGTRLNVGYFRQTHEHIDLSLTVWQYLQTVIVAQNNQQRASEQQARDLAGAFLFSGDEQDKPLADMSGGERSRAVLAGLVAGGHNLLVLDEPTNHLDIPSAERLEQALASDGGYEGTLLLITHDRTLLQRTCDSLLIFDAPGRLRFFPGDYRQWLDHQQQAQEQAARPSAPTKSATKAAAATQSKAAAQSDKAANPLAKLSLSKLEQRIEELDAQRAEIDRQLVDPQVYTDGGRVKDLQGQRDALIAEQQDLEAEWSRRADDA
jgi:ATP-binding cassette subfamily F protein 3